MFINIAQSFLLRPDIPNETIETLIIMILIPLFWILRGVAITGMAYPVVKMLFMTNKSKHFLGQLSFSIFWTIFNLLILLSNVDFYWKWVWIDIVGVFISISTLFAWNGAIIRQRTEHSFRNRK